MADIRLSSAKALGDKDLLNATSPAVLRFELAANMATLDGTVCPNGDDTSRHSIHVDTYPAGAELGADGEAMPRDASAFAIARMVSHSRSRKPCERLVRASDARTITPRRSTVKSGSTDG